MKKTVTPTAPFVETEGQGKTGGGAEPPIHELPPELEVLLTSYSVALRLQSKRSPRTVEAYVAIAHRYLSAQNFQEGGPHALEAGSLREFLRDSSSHLAAASQAQWVSALKNFLGWLDQEPNLPLKVSAQLARELSRPRVPQKMVTVFDEEDLVFLLKTLAKRPAREQLLFELLYGSGLRISEAHGLSASRFDLNQALLRVRGKRSKERQVPLTPGALRILKAHPHGFGANESDFWGQNPSVRTLRRWVEEWGKQSLLSDKTGTLHPHKLRHSIATHLLRRGARLPQVQKLLGHTRLGTTERYTHLDPQDLIRVYDQSFPRLPSEPSSEPEKTPRMPQKPAEKWRKIR